MTKLQNTVIGPNYHVYVTACRDLMNRVTQVKDHGEDCMFVWPFAIAEEFVDLLQKGETEARIVFLVYSLGLHYLKDSWFINDTGKRLSQELFEKNNPISDTWIEVVSSIRAEFD